jgi:molybdenum cofactor guanylyltransferase
MDRGAIVLCGGRSTRMGRDKASLKLHDGRTMLGRVVNTLAEVVPAEQIVCVAAPAQQVPELSQGVVVVRDANPFRGPLAGLATGLAAFDARPRAVYVSGCDSPQLVPEFVQRTFELLGDSAIAALHDGQRWQPLAAVYQRHVQSIAQELLASGTYSLAALLNSVGTRHVTLGELCDVDPQLLSLATCNTPAEFDALRRSTSASPR